nr:hypothetical protein [Chitinophaga sp. S165]
MQKKTQTSKNSTQLSFEEWSMSSPEASPASHSAWLDRKREQQITVTYGRKCLESLDSFNHVGWWQKTFLAFLIGEEGWYSSRSRLIWRIQATRSHQLYCRLVPLARPTFGTEYGLLPTPTSSDSWDIKNPRKDSTLLTGGMHSVTLMSMGHAGRLPTPTARDFKGPHPRGHHRKPDDLGGVIRFEHGIAGQLNPRFVAEMMGFPAIWTLLPFQPGVHKAFTH